MHYNPNAATSIVQQQLAEDWDNREFNYLISEQIKKISDVLGQFCK
jgi:hypothetical protein